MKLNILINMGPICSKPEDEVSKVTESTSQIKIVRNSKAMGIPDTETKE